MAPSPYDRPYSAGAANTTTFELEGLPVKGRTPSKASKRIRGEIACAECRRLKIRCDKTVPCSTCVKRGCGALCPNGTIPPGEGSRFVLAATDHLHQKLTRMEARMHSLEDALSILHGEDDDYPPEEEQSTLNLKAISEEPSQQESSLVDALGSLHIDGEGASRFFGPSGGAEKVKGTTAPFALRELDPSYLPPEINQFFNAFPFAPLGIPRTSVQETIESFLPPMERAIALCETFLEHLSWMFHIVSRRQLIDELIPAIYKQARVTYGPHELAVLLITLGIGALSVLTEPSIVTIKTLHLMSIYNGLSGKESNMEASYGFLDMASQVALRVTIDIDPSMWRFEGREAYERRVYFWNLLVAVLWQALVTGRPPSILSVYVDCKLPTEQEEYEFGGGGPPTGLGVWGHRANEECLLPIVRATLAVKAPSYDKILHLDRKIRDFGQPGANPVDERTAISMKNFIRSHYRDLSESCSSSCHRAFFAQVMIEHAADPMKSPYAHSVLAAYQGACNVLDDTLNQFTKKPLLVARIWRIWSLAFSAAVVVGTLAIRGINLNLEPPPLKQFQIACNMFRTAAETSSRAARALPVLQTMLVKAYNAQQEYHKDVPVASPDDEITIFGGRAEAIVRSPPTTPSPRHNSPEAPIPPSRQTTLRAPVPMQANPNPNPIPEMIIPPPPAGFDMGLENHYADIQARGLSQQSWEGLFREATGPVYDYSMDMAGNGGAMDDRWSSFMQINNVLVDEPQQQGLRVISSRGVSFICICILVLILVDATNGDGLYFCEFERAVWVWKLYFLRAQRSDVGMENVFLAGYGKYTNVITIRRVSTACPTRYRRT
ncbi:hypothetical protein B0H16DRAFT_1537516 [Mycena metata]|uniref:Zn(2)-C6 fungal-type domain-containing protein n=1 Tax=Mycena metata TaxID=1033252 RepID=A0AAD7J4H6_9AGAR|nr:hypothetical protein B0H16DRAFT_1537516 [Mycena metata]